MTACGQAADFRVSFDEYRLPATSCRSRTSADGQVALTIVPMRPIRRGSNICMARLLLTCWVLSTTATAAVAPLTNDQRVAAAIETRDVGALRDALRAGGQPNGNVQLPGQPYPIEQQWRALRTGDPEVVAALLDAGADLTVGISEAGCQPKIIQLYLDRGIAVDAHPPKGMPLLWEAVEEGAKRMPVATWTPEEESRHKACLQTVAYLVAHGAKIQGDRSSTTPLAEAVASGDLEYLKLFVDAGADFNERSDPLLFTALYWYAISVPTPQTKPEHRNDDRWPLRTVEFMLTHGANPNPVVCGSYDAYEDGRRFPYMGGETPLMVAARYGWYDMAKLLLQHGADPFVGRREVEEDTPMAPSDVASANGHVKTAALIKEFEKRSRGAAAPPAGASSPTFAECF